MGETKGNLALSVGEGWFGFYNPESFSIGFCCVAHIAPTVYVVHNAQITL